mmetsp:Transcript_26544/g.44437  ORF Transcript_26544/g.44437 Transcript_26544/m.44437 type:complete len:281 (-) Transcript_26544:1260-2102(-)
MSVMCFEFSTDCSTKVYISSLHFPVQIKVRLCTARPTVVLFHVLLGQLSPPLRLGAVVLECAIERPVERGFIHPAKHKTVLRPPPLVVHVEHRVRKPPRRSHNRDGAVLQPHHLREAARLEHRRHQNHIRCRVHVMRQILVVQEHDLDPGVVFELFGHPLELAHYVWGPRPQQHKGPALLCCPSDGVLDQVDALLWNQAGDARHQRRLDGGLVRRHAEALQQVLLAQALRGGVHGTVLRRQHGVPLRVPQGAVDPVQQAVELALVQLEGVLHPAGGASRQ